MDIVNLLAGTGTKAPLTAKPAGGNAGSDAPFTSILENATTAHGAPQGLTLLAASAPRAAATTSATAKDDPGRALRAKSGPADLLASKDSKAEARDTPQAVPNDAPKSNDKDALKTGKQTGADDKGKHADAADAANPPNTPIAAAIHVALAAVAARSGQDVAGEAGNATASVQRAGNAASGKAADIDARSTGSRHQLQQLQQTTQAVTSAATSSHAGADAGTPGNGHGFASQLLATADTTPHAAAPAHADNAAASSAANALFGTQAAPQAAAHIAAPAAAVSTATLQAPVGSTPWQNELGQQLIRFSQRGEHQIELHLHPKELGPLQISLHINDQVAQAHFFAAHAQVRDAVQQAIPQLREALAGQGIALGEAMVGQQQQQDPGRFGGSSSSPSVGGVTEVESPASAHPVPSILPRMGAGGVDLYA
ncbi:MAG: flagellar hook-length control protein FliK [Rhodanobacteraceae bacterium]